MKGDLAGHTGSMNEVPPVVRYRVIDGPAYLIGWRRGADGSWSALLAWVVRTDNGYRAAEDRVAANDVEPIPGQDYSQVPRRSDVGPGTSRARRRPTPPMDPTDPRDPAHDNRTLDRAVIENGLRSDEPDF